MNLTLDAARNMQGLGDITDATRPRVVGNSGGAQNYTWWQQLILAGTAIGGSVLIARNNPNLYGQYGQYGYGQQQQLTPEQIALLQQQNSGGFNLSQWMPIILIGGAVLLLTRK